jgi:hypothetical protein
LEKIIPTGDTVITTAIAVTTAKIEICFLLILILVNLINTT